MFIFFCFVSLSLLIVDSIYVAMDAIERYMLPLMEDFRQYGCNASPTFKVWDMLHNAIEIMLQNI
jgi:hypothetical protein